MNTLSTRFETVARVLPRAEPSSNETLDLALARTYDLSQTSTHLFASPLGPFFEAGRHHHLPRFVFFGPHSHNESLRIAFLAGFDAADPRTSVALAIFAAKLAAMPDLGNSLNLSFFPTVDVLGRSSNEDRVDLAAADWAHARSPELGLLGKDARLRGYQAFVSLDSTAQGDAIRARLRSLDDPAVPSTGVELLTSDDFQPWDVIWDAQPSNQSISEGPLTLADDLPFRPFELHLRFPIDWSADRYFQAVPAILERVLLRQRALHAHSFHI